jgi:hypothetical protein
MASAGVDGECFEVRLAKIKQGVTSRGITTKVTPPELDPPFFYPISNLIGSFTLFMVFFPTKLDGSSQAKTHILPLKV